MDRVAALATGQTWIGARAQSEGLTDKTLETYTVGQMVSDDEEIEMANAKETPEVIADAPVVDHAAETAEAVAVAVAAERARCGELVTAFAARDLDFCIAQIVEGADVTAAKAAAFDRVAVAPPVAPVAETPAPAPLAVDAETHAGADPVVSSEPVAMTWPDKVVAMKAERGCTYEQAFALAVKADPDHYKAYQSGDRR
jgi:hypothetical protein